LAGFDQKSNIVLADSKERVYSIDEGVEEIPLGLYLVKGEMMFVPNPFDLRIRFELSFSISDAS
jgi:U6 snRNA-associated Sm-like protein LSm8